MCAASVFDPGCSSGLQASPRSVENHVSSIFAKLDLADEPTVHRRVKATLLFLTESSH
jgi:DNA-binding NarL/FixJ family response regulator